MSETVDEYNIAELAAQVGVLDLDSMDAALNHGGDEDEDEEVEEEVDDMLGIPMAGMGIRLSRAAPVLFDDPVDLPESPRESLSNVPSATASPTVANFPPVEFAASSPSPVPASTAVASPFPVGARVMDSEDLPTYGPQHAKSRPTNIDAKRPFSTSSSTSSSTTSAEPPRQAYRAPYSNAGLPPPVTASPLPAAPAASPSPMPSAFSAAGPADDQDLPPAYTSMPAIPSAASMGMHRAPPGANYMGQPTVDSRPRLPAVRLAPQAAQLQAGATLVNTVPRNNPAPPSNPAPTAAPADSTVALLDQVFALAEGPRDVNISSLLSKGSPASGKSVTFVGTASLLSKQPSGSVSRASRQPSAASLAASPQPLPASATSTGSSSVDNLQASAYNDAIAWRTAFIKNNKRLPTVKDIDKTLKASLKQYRQMRSTTLMAQ